MLVVKIEAGENGSHRNQEYHGGALAEGWALCPIPREDMKNFPFGEVTVECIDEIQVVTHWEPGVMPEHDETEKESTLAERVADLEAENASLRQQMSFYEDCIVEMAMIVYA